MPLVAATHDGPFHADDVLAAAMLRRLHPGIAFVRTRDPARVAAADIAFDVGGRDDPGAGRFDHHMRERRLRPDGVPYAACGLVWRLHGAEIVAGLAPDAADAPLREALAAEIDGGLVRSIDAVDNGAASPAPTDLACIVDALNPVTGEDPAPGALFEEAVALAGRFLERAAAHALSGLRAVAEFAAAAAAAPDPRVVSLARPIPWGRAVRELGLPGLVYVVHPNRDASEWMCAAVRDHAGGPYALRRPLPEAWAGLRDAAFCEAAGVPDGIFCHPARFLCGARSRASAEALAAAALEESGG